MYYPFRLKNSPPQIEARPQKHQGCLYLPEIFDYICSLIDKGFEEEDRLRALGALARTCRSFQDSALDRLWLEKFDLVLLIKCMPSDLWHDDQGVLRLRREAIDSDWPRFLEYSRRVKFIGNCRHFHDLELDVTVYEKLGLPQHTLFPNLKGVRRHRHAYPYGGFEYLDWHMGPNVESLSVTETRTLDSDHDHIKLLQSKYPLVKHVTFTRGSYMNQVELTSTIVNGWSLLEDLEIDVMSREALLCISNLPKLRRFSMLGSNVLKPAFFPALPLAFPALESLIFQFSSLSFCSGLIGCLDSAALKAISVGLCYPDTAFAWKNFFTTVRTHCQTSTLTCFEVKEGYHTPDVGQALQPITIDTIRPLLGFFNLAKVELIIRLPYYLDMSATEDMARAWPHLQHLSLHPRVTHYTPLPSLFEGLFSPFTDYCSELNYMSIVVYTFPPVVYSQQTGPIDKDTTAATPPK